LEPRLLPVSLVAEVEDNHAREIANRFDLPSAEIVQLDGTISRRNDLDFFAFTAPISGTLDVLLRTRRRVGARLVVEDAQGRSLIRLSSVREVEGHTAVVVGLDYVVSLATQRRNARSEYQVHLFLTPPRTEPEPNAPGFRVSPSAETEPLPHAGDAADDVAIWVHPVDPAQSTVIGTDKDGGIAVYDLAGEQLQYRADGELNNVDARSQVPLGDQLLDLVVAGNRTNNSISVYRVNPSTRLLEDIAARTIVVGVGVYGSCLYRSVATGRVYVIVVAKDGRVEQWELIDNGLSRVDAVRARSFNLGNQSEGCVADDELGYLYIAEERVGVWKFAAEPDASADRVLVDSTAAGGHLGQDVEGLAIYNGGDGGGYLIVSSQGRNEFVVYRREQGNDYVGAFRVVAGNDIDGVTGTDGIDVVNANLGGPFSQGLFVVQDDRNDRGNQNFKLIAWQVVAAVLDPAEREAKR
jgi:3-phytase